MRWTCYSRHNLVIAAILMYVIGALGITAGAHRLWAHKSYKAKLPMRILLACWNSVAAQVIQYIMCMVVWCANFVCHIFRTFGKKN